MITRPFIAGTTIVANKTGIMRQTNTKPGPRVTEHLVPELPFSDMIIVLCIAGTGTVVNKTGIKQYQQATRDRSKSKTEGGKIIRVEAHPIPEHPRPRRVKGRVALVGDAAGYVTKCSGEGIYFAAKSGRMCAEAIVEASESGNSNRLFSLMRLVDSLNSVINFDVTTEMESG